LISVVSGKIVHVFFELHALILTVYGIVRHKQDRYDLENLKLDEQARSESPAVFASLANDWNWES